MTTTPKHLKLFRSHFALTQEQAGRLFNKTKKQWWRWEQNYDPIPVNFKARLRKKAKHLKTAMQKKDNWCLFCKRNIQKARSRGQSCCPYCGRNVTRSKKKRIQEVLPLIDL